MKFMNRRIALFIVAWASSDGIAQTHPYLEVFSDDAVAREEFPGVQVNYFRLSDPERVKEQYLPALPPDLAKATAIMNTFLASESGRVFREKISEAYQGHELMVKYQLEKVPAIVFDKGRYVIYGTTDVRQALIIYRERMQSRECNRANEVCHD